jgi:hypothetical protein
MRTASLLLCALVAACASNPAPRSALPTAAQAARGGKGAWVVVQYKDGARLAGELIACSDGQVFIFNPPALVGVPEEQIVEGLVVTQRTAEWSLVAWGIVGTLSTISHGILAIISGPIWIGTTIASAAYESRQGLYRYPAESWQDLRRWARFPQGLPRGVDAVALVKGRSASSQSVAPRQVSFRLGTSTDAYSVVLSGEGMSTVKTTASVASDLGTRTLTEAELAKTWKLIDAAELSGRQGTVPPESPDAIFAVTVGPRTLAFRQPEVAGDPALLALYNHVQALAIPAP